MQESILERLNRTIIGLKDQMTYNRMPIPDRLNRTIIGLKDIHRTERHNLNLMFESNYYRIESGKQVCTGRKITVV